MVSKHHEEPEPEPDAGPFAFNAIKLNYDGPFYLNKKRFTLFGLLFRRALKYTSNPRNLEALWKPVYFVWLDRMTTKYAELVCFQEQPVWSTPKDLDPDQSITAGKGQFITLIPDLGIARIGEDKDVWLLLCELKRSPRRAYMKQGMEFESGGWTDLLDKMKIAISQVQRQAFIALHDKDNATKIFLLAACGPFWSYVSVSREALTSETTSDQGELDGSSEQPDGELVVEQLSELKARVAREAKQLGFEKNCEQDEDEDLVQLEQEDVQHISSTFKMTRNDLQDQSDELGPGKPLEWADVMVTGSEASNKAINRVRDGINQLMKQWADTQKNRLT